MDGEEKAGHEICKTDSQCQKAFGIQGTLVIDTRIPEVRRFSDEDQKNIEGGEEKKKMNEEFQRNALVMNEEKRADDWRRNWTNDTNDQMMKNVQIENRSFTDRLFSSSTVDRVPQSTEHLDG